MREKVAEKIIQFIPSSNTSLLDIGCKGITQTISLGNLQNILKIYGSGLRCFESGGSLCGETV